MATPLRVLLIEDSPDDAELVLRQLREGGFEPDWERVDDRPGMQAALSDSKWELIIADHQMPRFSAPEALALLSQSGCEIPLIVVSGSIGEEEAVAAMRAGARDYFMKGRLARLPAAIGRELQEAENQRAKRSAEKERRAAERKLAELARRDRLTGLPNRVALEELIEQRIEAAPEAGGALAVLDVRLAQFERIEHTLGHAMADAVLREVASRLRDVPGPRGAVGRPANDGFALLLADADEESAGAAARRVLRALEEPVRVGDLPILVEGMIGISLFPDHGREPAALLRAAAIATRAARRSGASCTLYESRHDIYDASSLELLADLRQALEGDQLFLAYQPVVDLVRREVAGVEALLRWRHPRLGLVPPGRFIPMAERTALVKPLTRWVFNEALRQSRTWRERGIELPVAVNLSARNLNDVELPDWLEHVRETWDVPWEAIEFEVTESALMTDSQRSARVLERISAAGAALALDDFGTGYSSLAHLRRLPFSKLKIDKSFVIGMRTEEESAAIVQAIIGLARALGVESQAEGVEDQETLDRLARSGCGQAQGFHIGVPMTPDALATWLESSGWRLTPALRQPRRG